MKKFNYITCVTILALLIGGCSSEIEENDIYLDKPEDTNLEFWITQRVTFKEFEDKGCTYLPGWFGADEYLDSRYVADTGGNMAIPPDIHVTYLVTGYPDTLDNDAVTHIEITDPTITVYGLTLNSTDDEIKNRVDHISDSYVKKQDDSCIMFIVKNCSFCFIDEKIVIDVPVTNNSGIVY